MNLRYKSGLLLLGMLPLTAAWSAQTLLHKNDKPNIVYILADDLGYADLGCYGQQMIETPHIDQLAKEGMIFTNHYSGQAVSAPSRCALLTGLHSGHAYIRSNHELESRGDVWSHKAMLADSTLEGQCPLPETTVMIPRKLKEVGYTTACIGKWGLGYPGSESTPNKMGFDFFYGYNCQRQAQTYYPPFLYRNECREYLNNQLLEPHTRLDKSENPDDGRNYQRFVQQDYAPDLMYKEIFGFVEKNARRPFALFWMTPVPHLPLQAPQHWIDYYHKKIGEEQPYRGNHGYFPCQFPKATYAAMISYLDEQIGGLVDKLKELGLYENTLIIFTSDNGSNSNGGAVSEFFKSANPNRTRAGWTKGSLREGGIHVPMIACWPEEIKRGTTTDLLSASWDVMPTLCDLADVETPATDGISMLPTLKGKHRRQKKHDYLYWENPAAGGQKAVRMGKWKAFVGNIYNGNRKVELYDLSCDPLEQVNVADQHPEIVADVLKCFRESHKEPEVKRFSMPVW